MGHLLQSGLLHSHVSAGVDLGSGNIDMAKNITDVDDIRFSHLELLNCYLMSRYNC